ncbi:NAD(P)-dependent oxidoreductase [bacterium LRH843]|nr:NAD(P)-dependent oxidoreductase [bacterium LRH843]
MKILVTGGFGLIGANVVKRLSNEGHQVILFDKEIDRSTDFFVGSENIKYIEGDLTNQFTLSSLFANDQFDAIVHSAANLNGEYCKMNPIDAVQLNTMGTLSLLELARIHGVNKFIYVGSGSVFGKQTTMEPIDERAEVTPMNTYATTKRLSEELVRCYRVNYGMDATTIRVSWVFGPLPKLKVPRWNSGPVAYYTYKVLSENNLNEPSGSDFIANFTYIDNVIDGIVCLLNTNNAPEFVHLSSEQLYSTKEIVDFLMSKLPNSEIYVGEGAEPFELQAPMRGALVSNYKDQIGFKPNEDLKESLEEYFYWMKRELEKRNVRYV